MPQLYMFQKQAGEAVETLVSHFVFALGFARIVEMAFWMSSFHEVRKHLFLVTCIAVAALARSWRRRAARERRETRGGPPSHSVTRRQKRWQRRAAAAAVAEAGVATAAAAAARASNRTSIHSQAHRRCANPTARRSEWCATAICGAIRAGLALSPCALGQTTRATFLFHT